MGGDAGLKYKLNTGTDIPAIGFGTVAFDQEGPDVVKTGVLNAIKVGYRHFDTAAAYGTEAIVGEALADAFKSGLAKREDVFVTTKIWKDDLVPELVPVAFHKSLSNLGLDYLDLYLIHFPLATRKGSNDSDLKDENHLPLDLKGVWQELEKLKEQGLVRAIGVSNFSIKRLQELLAVANIPPAVNQVELHPVWQSAKLLEYCKRKGIHVTAYSPLGAPGQVYVGRSNLVLTDPTIKEIAEKHGKSPAQISLRWVLEQGASLVPKSYNEVRLAQNFDIFDWSLTAEDYEKIRAIPQHKILHQKEHWFGPFYKTFEEFWDDNE